MHVTPFYDVIKCPSLTHTIYFTPAHGVLRELYYFTDFSVITFRFAEVYRMYRICGAKRTTATLLHIIMNKVSSPAVDQSTIAGLNAAMRCLSTFLNGDELSEANNSSQSFLKKNITSNAHFQAKTFQRNAYDV